MSEKIAIRTEKSYTSGAALSQAIRKGNIVYTSGVVGRDPVTGEYASTVAEQTAQLLKNLQGILEAAGTSLEDVVKCTVHLQDLQDWAEFDKTYRDIMPQPYPARTSVGSNLGKNALVEIDAMAVLE